MTDPLSPLSASNANRNTPARIDGSKSYTSPTKHAFVGQDIENQPLSSPYVAPSSPSVGGNGISPFKTQSPQRAKSPQKQMLAVSESIPLTENALRENEGLTRTINIMEDSANDSNLLNGEDDAVSARGGGPQGFAGMDDTCFSAFSAVPNADMTRFANLGQSPSKGGLRSPTKYPGGEGPTPRPKSRGTPARKKDYYDDSCSSPTPRHYKSNHDDDTTNLLVDFTDQFSTAYTSNRSPSRNGRLSPNKKYHTQPDLAQYAASRRTPSPTKCPLPPDTPSGARQLANLLDFDLPPAPTPRSIPSITARELESMKSAFQSQISSFKAELSGKEAEVKSLKQAVNDAETRVGEALEEVRNERDAREALKSEKADWEKRQQEMQGVLKEVKEEIIRGDREKDALLQRVQEAEHKRDEVETRAIEAETRLEGMQRSAAATASPGSEPGSNSLNVNAQVEAAVTKVAKELHGLYKIKHEAKVTALKKSYSDRWEKKIKDLSSKIDDLSIENEDLRVGRDATMTGLTPESEVQKAEREAQLQRLEDQKKQLETIQREFSTAQQDLTATRKVNRDLTIELESSRAETADLIAATEELMLLSQSAMSASAPADAQPVQDLTRSSNRSTSATSGSGLKAPGFSGGYSGESRIGKVGGGGGGNFSRDRSGSGLVTRSGIMSNIERMGRGRAVD